MPTDEIVVLPSEKYAVKQLEGPSGPILQVLQNNNGKWVATPAQWYAKTLREHVATRIAIDFGAGWALDEADTLLLVTMAHRIHVST